jgi:flavorubredoxin
MTTVDETAPDVYRISTYVEPFDLQFNQYLVKDEKPLLFHTGLKALFPAVQEAVARVLDPASIRWFAFSHFESDECGPLNEWLELAPSARAACSQVGAIVSVNDFAIRPARPLVDGAELRTGKYRFRFISTPHTPHAWDSGLLFEETQRTLLCSDLFHQLGNREALTEADLVGRMREALVAYRNGPLDGMISYTDQTETILERLAGLAPKYLAPMHGSAFVGDGQEALTDLAAMVREVAGPGQAQARPPAPSA